MTDVRWQRRFQNFRKTLELLESALALPAPDPVQRAGIVQFFEMAFELSWKVLKDYLEAQGLIDVKTPRSALKAAFEIGLVRDGHRWLQGLEDRNLVVHTRRFGGLDYSEAGRRGPTPRAATSTLPWRVISPSTWCAR